MPSFSLDLALERDAWRDQFSESTLRRSMDYILDIDVDVQDDGDSVTLIAEVKGSSRSPWWLLPAALSLAVFAWLLTLHPAASGRVYAAYGGVYVTMAVVWLWAVDGIRPDPRACLISPHAPRCVAAARQGSSVAQRQTGRLVKRRAGAGGPLRRNPEG